MKIQRNRFQSLTEFTSLLIFSLFAAITESSFATAQITEDQVPTDGLILWLDAADPGGALSAGELEKPLQQWLDKSKRQLRFEPSSDSTSPRVVRMGDDFVIRFDGEDDFLRHVSKAPLESAAATVFIVCAPSNNHGQFRGLVAANASNQFDYQSGFNVDMGPTASLKLNCLNVEGNGFSGAVDLLSTEEPFGELQIIQLTVDPEAKSVKTRINNHDQDERACEGLPLSLQEITIGARYFEKGLADQKPFGPLSGDIAEVMIYQRVLTAEQLKVVSNYLETKYSALKSTLPRNFQKRQHGAVLEKIDGPPLVQMVIPGFEVYELPVELNNINNVRYRTDGKLVALGYDGDIHLLSDTNNDGLEDTAEVFWKSEGRLRGPIGMAITPAGYEKGEGVFVPSKGKLSLIVDTDDDNFADEEIIVATGWPEIFTNVDAVGVCLDEQHNVYFGLGVADFSNAYQIGEDGIAKYDRTSENGTIQKVSADFSNRETICTGIRYPIGMAINQHGDLFCTEQEGATWLPNGNPLDELLWIRDGRHYGFPPRHPRHNPDVIDEPSVFEYGPQHQSTCGMIFNRPVNAGPVFGDRNWTNDAIVSGESRGKIWRTTLHKTQHGYLAQNQLLACLQMLTIDSCVAPNGDLVVCCHSGAPDWGTGPTGQGKLFRIRALQKAPAKPILAWQQSENEIRIAFDKPVDPQDFAKTRTSGDIYYGKFVRAGDEFENLIPPYVAVNRQLLTPRFKSTIHSIGLTSDRRTMVLASDSINENLSMAVSLPTADKEYNEKENSIQQMPLINIDVQSNGVLATVEDAASPESQAIWLPHINSDASRDFTKQSRLHQQWFQTAEKAKTISIATQLNLHHLLRPAIQPGESIDYQWPVEEVTIEFQSNATFLLIVNQEPIASVETEKGFIASFTHSGEETQYVDVTMKIEQQSLTDREVLKTDVRYWTNEDDSPRVIPIQRLHLPWRKPSTDRHKVVKQPLPNEIAEASWGRGRQIFHGSKANCFKCHIVDGSGGKIGPELSNLRHRDFHSVMRDVVDPSFAINPDYVGNTVLLDDGRVLTGVIRAIDGQQQIGNPEGLWIALPPASIEEIKPAHRSVMPANLLDDLNQQERSDLFAYLLKEPPSMPRDSPLKAPPLRSKQEVAEVLAGAEADTDPEPLTITLVAGPKDHGPGEHDYPAWQKQWGQLLTAAEDVTLQMAWEFPEPKQLENSNILVFFQKGDWNDQRQAKMDEYFQRGGGAVYLHWAVNGNRRARDFSKRIGLASKAGSVGYRHGALILNLHNTDDPIMRNLGSCLELYDESYWKLAGEEEEIQLLASSQEEGQLTPQIWTYQPKNGRVFVSIPGHYNWTFDDPVFRTILLRGMAWTADQPVDRFNELVPLGARMQK